MKTGKIHSQVPQSSVDYDAGGRRETKASSLPSHTGQFRLVFKEAPIGMAIVGLDYQLRKVNKALCEALGYSEKELLSIPLTEITHPDDVGKTRKMVERLFAGEIPSYRIEKRFITKDGNLAWLDLTALLIHGPDNEPLYGLAMVENITERRRISEALRASEERYRSFIVNSSEGIWRFEIERPLDTKLPADEQIALFFKNAYLAECNDAMARMYGHERAEDMIGARFGDFALSENPANIALLRRFINNGYRLLDAESIELDREGNKRYISNSVIGIVLGGQLLRIWGTQRDQTEQRRAEEELRATHQRIRSLAAYLQAVRERERADIAREIHDVLGQALVSLKLDVAWMQKKVPTAGTADEKALIEQRLTEASNLLEATIASVKTLSAELRPGVLDKFGLAAAIEWQCQEFQRRSGIKCDCRLPRKDVPLPPERATALFRILQEALTNVARHSGAQSVKVRLEPDPQGVTLTVHDDGRGITTEQITAIDSLGLLGMRERAEMLGGRFGVEGKRGKGTILSVSIGAAASVVSAGATR